MKSHFRKLLPVCTKTAGSSSIHYLFLIFRILPVKLTFARRYVSIRHTKIITIAKRINNHDSILLSILHTRLIEMNEN